MALDGDAKGMLASSFDSDVLSTEERIGRGTLQLVFGDLGVDEVAVYLPKARLVTGVPVVDAEPPLIEGLDPILATPVAEAPVAPMISYTVDLAQQTRRTSSQESTTVSLGSDVLFASSSADITPEAGQVIADAAVVIASREPGEVQVVGHTEDVDDDAFHLDLSLRRARAVADALQASVDTTRYPLVIDGKGEPMPVASNTLSSGKAMNRRVELTISTPVSSTAPDGATAPIAFDGPTSTAPDPVTWEDGSIPLEFRAQEARMVQGHLVVTMTLTRTDGEIDSIFGPGNRAGTLGMPEGVADDKTHFGMALIDGGVAHLVVAHALGGPRGSIRPLTDSASSHRLDSGHPRVVELVFPRDDPVGDEVTIQLVSDVWRITGIPVTR